MAFKVWREEQAGEEAEDHRRHRFHQFDHRLDLAAHARCHEVGGVDGGGNGQRCRQDHRVERGLEGTEGQWRQAQLGFEVGVRSGRLPDVLRLVVVLVPDLAPQRAERHFRVRVVQAQRQQLATFFDDDAVGTWRQGQDASAFGGRLDQQGTVRGAVEHTQLAGGVEGDEAFATLFGIDLDDRGVAHLERANLLEARLAIRIASHEPLAQATLGVTEDQRDTADQLATCSDFGVAVFEQLVATVEALVAQAEDIGRGAAVDHVQPLLTRVDVDGFDRFGHLRQVDTVLLAGDLTGHHVFFAGQLGDLQVRTGGTGQQQVFTVDVDAHVFQCTPLVVQHEWLLAIRIVDAGGDGFFVVRVGDFIGVVEHQRLAVGQTQHDQRAARLVGTDGGYLGIGRQRQVDALELSTGLGVEEQRLALVGNSHAYQVLLFEGDHQRFAGILLQPGRLQGLLAGQLGTLEQRQHHVGQIEEDQGNRCQYGKPAHQDVPAGQAILERAHAALALQLGRIEINAHRRRFLGHCGVGQIIHAHTLAVPYDKNMTMQ
ncbi:hypothetical protein D3C81_876120 [compost metagenome]